MKNKQRKEKQKQKQTKAKNSNRRAYTCPCCKQPRSLQKMQQILQLRRRVHEQHIKHYPITDQELFTSFTCFVKDWACDVCIKTGNAILADPLKQYGAYSFSLAYKDEGRTCRSCGQDYTFSKEEKLFWYEGKKFCENSKPQNCVPCRREIRAAKKANTRLSTLLKDGAKQLKRAELEEVISIYVKMKLGEKVKFYQAMLKYK